MSHSLTLKINLENFNFFKYKFLRFLLSPAQKNVMQELKKAREGISRLKKQDFLELTAHNEFHISRGAAYAITEFLQERFDQEINRLNDLHAALELKNINLHDLRAALELKNNNLDDLRAALKQKNINLEDLYSVIKQKEISLENLHTALEPKKISLEDLQQAFENNYQIKDKEILSAIILCLVEPVWIPGNLAVLALSLLLPTGYHCSNLSGNGSKKSGLQVNTKADSNSIEFCYNLHIMGNATSNLTEDPVNDNCRLIEGSVAIYFSIEKTIPLRIKLLPITMQFNFSDEQKSKQFQQKLAKNFKGWLLHENELNYIRIKLDKWRAIIDFWVIPILLIGLLIGLSAMASFTALSLIPISPLLLPPLGLALGLCFAGAMHSYAYMRIKKEQEEWQRPIHLFNRNPIQTTAFFDRHRSEVVMESESNDKQINVMSSSRSERGHP